MAGSVPTQCCCYTASGGSLHLFAQLDVARHDVLTLAATLSRHDTTSR
jgi:hypothetical protein